MEEERVGVLTDAATTKMSSKGQVVIPEEIRTRLGLSPGTRFVVLGERDVVILKALTSPTMDDFDELIREARRQARTAGLGRADVRNAVIEEKKSR
ncbi:MAG: AbrB/MazE/SpoVT family DNA-binding domain-containing protein [Actinobacteria bacterium]|nr:AbrB/MazE/SpoVT family DNA-binding domain-containing protein [Actinomycetota bacterium]